MEQWWWKDLHCLWRWYCYFLACLCSIDWFFVLTLFKFFWNYSPSLYCYRLQHGTGHIQGSVHCSAIIPKLHVLAWIFVCNLWSSDTAAAAITLKSRLKTHFFGEIHNVRQHMSCAASTSQVATLWSDRNVYIITEIVLFCTLSSVGVVCRRL